MVKNLDVSEHKQTRWNIYFCYAFVVKKTRKTHQIHVSQVENMCSTVFQTEYQQDTYIYNLLSKSTLTNIKHLSTM